MYFHVLGNQICPAHFHDQRAFPYKNYVQRVECFDFLVLGSWLFELLVLGAGPREGVFLALGAGVF